jgi:Rrf2 family nitric oxide-sensitive transcriptional repressor
VGGGIRLARPAQEISVGEVVRVLEGNEELIQCVGKAGPCQLLPDCGLKHHLGLAEKAFYNHLNNITLADCLKGASKSSVTLIGRRQRASA